MINLNPGLKFKLKRIETGLTQEQLAQKIGSSKATICNFENGKLEPRLNTLKKMCSAVGVDVKEILF